MRGGKGEGEGERREGERGEGERVVTPLFACLYS